MPLPVVGAPMFMLDSAVQSEESNSSTSKMTEIEGVWLGVEGSPAVHPGRIAFGTQDQLIDEWMNEV
jgi:hypothetical protein